MAGRSALRGDLPAANADGWYDNLVLFDRGRLVREPVGPSTSSAGSSRARRAVGWLPPRPSATASWQSTGRQTDFTALDYGSGIAWSPDENWIAEATEGGIWVFRTDDVSPQLVQVPVVARDVLWLGPRRQLRPLSDYDARRRPSKEESMSSTPPPPPPPPPATGYERQYYPMPSMAAPPAELVVFLLAWVVASSSPSPPTRSAGATS